MYHPQPPGKCVEYLLIFMYILFPDDLEPNSLAVIPGMGIPEQLKLAMEQEQLGKRNVM